MPKHKKPHARRWIEEFKEFSLRGNVMDLAVGVIVGGAFGKITASLVGDVFMPVIGMLLGGVNFSNFNIKLAEARAAGETPVMLNLGNFINTIVDFVLITLSIFLFVKLLNALRRKGKAEEPAAPPPPPAPDVVLLTEIRDLLKREEKGR